MHGLRLWAPVVASCLAATSCSMAKFGYDTLPTWAHWQVERYFALDEEQREIVSRNLDDLHRWHRRSQLPQYVAFLREVDDGLRTSVDAADVARWRDRVAEAWIPLADRIAPGLAELALTLRPEQIDRMRKRLEESNEEAREKYLPIDRPVEEVRAERVVKRAEFFFGRLTRAQQRELQTLAAVLPPSEETWLAERESRQKRFVALLRKIHRERPSRAEATRLCREYLRSMWHSHDARRRDRIDATTAASDELTAYMLARATPAQRAHLSKLLRGYAEDFASLSGIAQTAAR
jgi:hypothetical protein